MSFLDKLRDYRHKCVGYLECDDMGYVCQGKDSGFCNCPYSPEGLCLKCESRRFPERFKGCLFCRRQQKYACCSACGGVYGWIMKYFEDLTESETMLGCAINDLTTHNKSKFPFLVKELLSTLDFIDQFDRTTEWPGFFTGYDKKGRPTWEDNPKFNPTLVDISDMTYQNGATVLNRELEKQGIFINHEVQLDLEVHSRGRIWS